jgi:DNA-binding transcriptional ArsR family regulator
MTARTLPTRETLTRYGLRFPNMRVDVVDEALHMLRRASLLMRELEAYFGGPWTLADAVSCTDCARPEPSRSSLLVSEIAERLDVSRPVITQTMRALQSARLSPGHRQQGRCSFKVSDLDERGTQEADAPAARILRCHPTLHGRRPERRPSGLRGFTQVERGRP